ncbi:MAG: Rrf2 family transcriptional regulator [Alphaproteobacteria bacterium]|jgi:Rrf2 family iron-sulfur cluster assembly transcriptional regulator|nr:Rrf2 family transcriptional regulator [Alphaproteobacteria bacterium]
MKLSTKGRYAVMAMIDIATNLEDKENVSIQAIAERNNISTSYLEQLFIKLKKNNLVSSSKGPNGGYKLARAPKDIFIFDVIQAVDEKIEFLRCKNGSGCAKNGFCNSHDLWSSLMANICNYLSSISLEEVINNTYNNNILGAK